MAGRRNDAVGLLSARIRSHAMAKVSAFVKLTAQPGRRHEMLDALRAMLPVVADEPGTEVYSFHLDQSDENVVWVFELYRDTDALDAHSSSDGMKALLGALAGLLADAPTMVFATPSDAKGLTI